MTANFEDVYFDEDAIYMERNSRDFRRGIAVVNYNTLSVCEFLHSRSLTVPTRRLNVVSLCAPSRKQTGR